MGPVSAYSGQQSVSPLTKQLRGQERPDVALKNSETLKERTTSNQSGATPVASTKGSSDRNLTTQTATSNQNQSSPNSPRGSVLDVLV